MIWLSIRMLRLRWPVYVGSFLALVLGVCLMTITLLGLAGALTKEFGQDELAAAVALLGNAAGVSGVAAVFVVVGTFSFAVVLRRREFALLRAIGATSAQVRRLVLGESMVIGLAAAITGSALGVAGAPYFANWMASAELAPPGFAPHITWWPMAIAGGVGFISALLGASLASWRASKALPVEALRLAETEQRVMTTGRWIGGLGLLGGAAALVPVALSAPETVSGAYVLLEILILLTGVVLLLPSFTPALLRLISWPLGNVTGWLAQANMLTGLRRTSSMIAPIFFTVALAGGALSSTATLGAERTDYDARIDQAALLTVVGLAALYTAISIANTCVMATASRLHDLAVLRLSGATLRQVLGMIVAETYLVTMAAAMAAAVVVVTALVLTSSMAAGSQIVVPWMEIIGIVVACFGIALSSSIATTLWSLKIKIVLSTEK